MKNDRNLLRPAAVLLVLSLWTASAFGVDANQWGFLPTRILEIEGGAVAFKSVVVVDTRNQLDNPLFQDYPTKYILPTTNESDFPVWVEAEWRAPGEKPFIAFGKIDPGHNVEIFVKVNQGAWGTPIPVGITIYADEGKSRKLGGRDVVLQFGEEEKDMFLQSAKQLNSTSEKFAIANGKKAWIPLLPGFQEMLDVSKPVPGTDADKTLTEDIKLLLWKNQSRHHWDCTHEILGAQQFDPKMTAKFQNMPAKDKQLIEEGQARGDVAFEEWQIKSCGSVSTYLVLMGKSSKEGVNIMAVKIQDDALQ